MFVDKVKIYIKAGDGGDGAVSFHREKYVAAGGPDGGNGGKGGNIVFQVDTNLSTLLDFRYHKKYVAKRGENGGAKRCTGKSAPDLVIKVPRGTIVRNAKNGRIMADLSTDEPQILAKGGNGGRGNCNFATSTRQIPRFAKPGFPGEEFEVILELKRWLRSRISPPCRTLPADSARCRCFRFGRQRSDCGLRNHSTGTGTL